MRVLALVACVGCVADLGDEEAGGGGGKADDNGTCTDPLYGDGTCHVDLSCGIPDIDCFKTFTSDEEAAAAMGADGVSTLTGDPRYAAARARLDKSWQMYKAGVQLGALADKHLALILVPDSSINAYVYPTLTPGVGYFAINVNVGMLDSAMTEDEFHGIMFHELTHLAKLHLSAEVADKLRRYYAAPEGSEPIGAIASESAKVREAMEEWRTLATFMGAFTDAALADLPYGGELQQLFGQYLARAAQTSPTCTSALEHLQNVSGAPTFNPIDQTLVIAAGHQADATALLAEARRCVGSTITFAQLRGMLGMDWTTFYAPHLTPDDAQLDAMPALDAIVALVADRRARMRALEESFTSRTGRPFASARFFSQEEQADDVSARLTKANNLTDQGVSGFLFAALAEQRAECEALLAGDAPVPYGRYLIDDHHADCWRIAHARQLTADDAVPRVELDAPTAREPWVPTRVVPRKPLY